MQAGANFSIRHVLPECIVFNQNAPRCLIGKARGFEGLIQCFPVAMCILHRS